MACEKLSSLLPGKVFLPDTETYTSSTASYYYREARQKPQCIVRPTSAEDVSTVIKTLADTPGTKFAIRSGGHSPHPEVSSTENGVTIDLRGLNSITKSDDREDVYKVGAGANWGELYDILGPERIVVGAREHTVGVGGFVTGGGLSFFAPERGFACDNVANMEVVLASGEIVNANATSNPDLFRALKGGQANFGVVTRFDIITYQPGTFWGGGILHPFSTEEAHLEAFRDFKNDKFDPLVQVLQSYIYIGPTNNFFGAEEPQEMFFISNNIWYLRPIENAPALKRFTDIQPQMRNSLRISHNKDFSNELTEYQPKNQYATYVTTTFSMTPTIMKKINALWKDASSTLSPVHKILSSLTYQLCPPPPPQETGGNAMGFEAGSKPHENLIILINSLYWERGEDCELVKKTTKELIEKIEAVTVEEGAWHPYKYVNYVAKWQDSFKSYGEDLYHALKDVSKKYDPHGLFQKQAVGFKL